MNKTELVKAVADASGLSQSAAAKAVDATFSSITDALKQGDKVSLIGFGTFGIRERAARSGRDPRTGKPIEIKAAKVPDFKAGKGLKEAVK